MKSIIKTSSLVTVFFLLAALTSCTQPAKEYVDAGVMKYEKGDYRGALEDYNKAIELDPNNADAYLGRSVARKWLERKALQDYNKAIELDPTDATSYYGRGIAKFKLGEIDSGCRDWSKAGEMGHPDAKEAIEEYCR